MASLALDEVAELEDVSAESVSAGRSEVPLYEGRVMFAIV